MISASSSGTMVKYAFRRFFFLQAKSRFDDSEKLGF
jgi:hypothetical protein